MGYNTTKKIEVITMEKFLQDVLSSREENYIFPFYWQHGNHTNRIPEQVSRIAKSGARALCVESRPHGDFCGETWWRDLELIFEACEKENMVVWILDDSHFPTGFADGAVRKNPDKRKVHLMESHVDLVGPMKDARCFVRRVGENSRLLGAFLFERDENGRLMPSPKDVTAFVEDDVLSVTLDEGFFRVFFLFSANGADLFPDYIDMISPSSVELLVDTVYETHYAHFKDRFGTTFRGFFSDEPAFANGRFNTAMPDRSIYDYTLGFNGLALPWSDELRGMLDESLGESSLPLLPLLWFDGVANTGEVRFAYMDAVTSLYRKHFTQRLARWCEEHGVEYIGHVVEDMNVSGRLGYGSGHYFRALSGQDMSGFDIVLHQVLPGFATMSNAASCYEGEMDSEFFHYVLAKLASSMGHLDKKMKKRVMCELFGAYGWAEGTRTMKWLADFCLVRGTNHFVPHAFSPNFPDPDCPPHFGAEGVDPQFEGFSVINRYMNKAAHLLIGGTHMCDALVLYDAEAEWLCGKDKIMRTQKVAHALADTHIDYDIIPCDTLLDVTVKDGKLLVADESYTSLVIPYTPKFPKKYIGELKRLKDDGANVIFADAAPDGEDFFSLPLSKVAEKVASFGVHVRFDGNAPLLRHYMTKKGGSIVLMLFNESVSSTARGVLELDAANNCVSLDLLGGESASFFCDGKLDVSLAPYESRIFVIGDVDIDEAKMTTTTARFEYDGKYDISIANYKNMDEFAPFSVGADSPELNGKLKKFAGLIRYELKQALEASDKPKLELENVGECCKVFCNGKECGIRVCPPYRFDLSPHVQDGENKIVIECATTLAEEIDDGFSKYMQLSPIGISGRVSFLKTKLL